MAERMTLEAAPRADFGKERMKKLRRDARIPGVIYGAAGEPEHITVPSHDLTVLAKRIHGMAVLFDVVVRTDAGTVKKETVFLREIQRDPVTQAALHVDLLRVDPNKAVTVEVPVISEGDPAGVKEGGMLETLQRTLTIHCLPGDIPPVLRVDISGIQTGRSMFVRDVAWPAKVQVLNSPDTVLFTVLGKVAEEEAPVAAEAGAAEAAEPEVIGRKKKEEEEEASE